MSGCTLCLKPAPDPDFATTCVRCGAITIACRECSDAVDPKNRAMAMQVRMAVGHGCAEVLKRLAEANAALDELTRLTEEHGGYR